MKVEKKIKSAPATSKGVDISKLLEQYGGPVKFTGADDALYERHLVFDNVMEETTIGARERFEAIARSVRDKWRLLHASGGSQVVSGSRPEAMRGLRRFSCVVAQSDLKCGRLRKILERPHDR